MVSILDRLLGRKSKKESIVETESSMQDIRDAMLGKNGKMTLMPGVLIDTITMREIPMRGTSTKLTTVRGTATLIQHFISNRSGRMSSKYRSANLMALNIGGKDVNIHKDNSLPIIDENDDVEAMCIPTYSKDVLDALVLKNHTSGTLWCFSGRKAALGF